MCAALLGCAAVSAQTDYTSRIVNPSFEREAEGWAHKGMGAQGNNVFDIKDGNIYMEKWTGRGGAVGDGYLRQELSSQPARSECQHRRQDGFGILERSSQCHHAAMAHPHCQGG